MAKTKAASTQEHLPIAGIQDSVVIMTDGSIRVVVRLEPINFDLKSETEQNAIIFAYQGFLNSLEFPIQIVIQSKKLDLERYLSKLEASQKEVDSDLLRIQIEDYVGFVRRLISVANIMSKRFYVVISYSPVARSSGGIAQVTKLLHKQPSGPLMNQDEFTRFRAEAVNRASVVAGGLGRLGVKSRLLSTQELIELFYGIYNPDLATEERLTGDISDLSSGVVTAAAPLGDSPAEATVEPEPPVLKPEVDVAPIPPTPVSTEAALVPPAPEEPEPAGSPMETPPLEETPTPAAATPAVQPIVQPVDAPVSAPLPATEPAEPAMATFELPQPIAESKQPPQP